MGIRAVRSKLARLFAPNLVDQVEVDNLLAQQALAAEEKVKVLVAEEVQRARMSFPIPLEYDPQNEGYRRISDTIRNRDLTPMSQDLMFELAYYLYDTSGLVKRFVRDTKNFILGEGVEVSVENDDDAGSAQKLIKAFWDDSVNCFDLRLEKRVEFLGLLGEQCWPVQVNPMDGSVRTSYIDPVNVVDVFSNPDWPEIPVAVKLRGTAGRSGAIIPTIREESDFRKREYGRMVGDCFFFSINNPPNSHRGRSDLIQSFDFINALEENLYDEGDRVKLIKAFIWDVTLNGANDDDIKEFLKNNKTPKPGSIRAHNDRVVWSAVAPDLKLQDSKAYFDALKSFLAASQNRPESWLGAGGKVYQTEAALMGEPTFKDLGSRQRYVKYMLEYVLKFVVDQAILFGKLKEDPNKKLKAVVSMPEMAAKDLTPIVTALFQFAQALVLAQTNGWITSETATKMFLTVAERVGLDVDAAIEIQNLASEAADTTTDPNVTKDYAAKEALIQDLVARIEARKKAA